MKRVLTCGLILCSSLVSQAYAEIEWEAESTFQFRYFTDENADATADDGSESTIFLADDDFYPVVNQTLEFSTEDSSGDNIYVGSLFFHYDVKDDDNRYADIRELYWLGSVDDYQVKFGFDQVSWGVNEIFRTVDVINQLDTQAWPQRQKLGQPLLSVATEFDDHLVEVYTLFDHRKRRYGGEDARLRYPILVDNDETIYDRGETGSVDFAIRWQFSFWETDISVAHFYGVSREPYFVFNFDFDRPRLIPVYQKINQTSIELTKSFNELLTKLEAQYQVGGLQHFYSVAGGIEYPMGDVLPNGIDLTLYVEAIYDSRDEANNNVLNRDVAFAFRMAFNDSLDSSMLFAFVADYEYQEQLLLLNLTTRPAENWQIDAIVNVFNSGESEIDRALYDDAWDNAFAAIEDNNLPLPLQIVSDIYGSIPDLTLSRRDFDNLVGFVNEIQQPGGYKESYAETVPDVLFNLMRITDASQKVNVIESDDYVALSVSYLF